MASEASYNVGLNDIGGMGGNPAGNAASQPVLWKDRIEESIQKSRKIRGGNYVQIATVDENGLPHCRTVVFRGFVAGEETGGKEALRMITDARSEKVEQGRRSPACEIVWWFSQSSEQYRFAGTLQFVGADADGSLRETRLTQWRDLRDPAREQFWWDQPNVPFTGEPSPPRGGRGTDGEILAPPDSFLLMLMRPTSVKYLRLTDNYAQVDVLDAGSGEWSATRVNP